MEEMEERCRCGHLRGQHANHVNPLEVVPLAMTEVDEGDRETLAPVVRGAGKCMVEGCDCEQFTDEEP